MHKDLCAVSEDSWLGSLLLEFPWDGAIPVKSVAVARLNTASVVLAPELLLPFDLVVCCIPGTGGPCPCGAGWISYTTAWSWKWPSAACGPPSSLLSVCVPSCRWPQGGDLGGVMLPPVGTL